MPSTIKLHGVSGLIDESPPCYLLEFNKLKLLLDCGWDQNESHTYLRDLKNLSGVLSGVLISHPDMVHLGAIAYLVCQGNLHCPIYMTMGTYKMGQMALYDYVLSKQLNEEFSLFSLDDVDKAMERVVKMKYCDPLRLKGNGEGVIITALPAGHMLGGTIWKISREGQEDIYYSSDFNHKRERHLNGSVDFSKIVRPSVFIAEASYFTNVQESRRTLDEKLLSKISQILTRGGNVLLPTDTSGRVLELSLLLDQSWRERGHLSHFPLILLSNVAYNVIEFAKTLVSWTSDKLITMCERGGGNPFIFKYLKICHTLDEIHKIPSPKVILCSGVDLEVGFSRELFLAYSSNPKNGLIFTSRGSKKSLGRFLLDNPHKTQLVIDVKERVKLVGRELVEFLHSKKETHLRNIIEMKTDKKSDVEAPTKCISSRRLIPLSSSLDFIDLEGKSDGDSLKKILTSLSPSRLILTRGYSTSTLTSFLTPLLKNSKIFKFSGAKNEWLDVSGGEEEWEIRLKSSVVKKIKLEGVGGSGVEIGRVSGRVEEEGARKEPVLVAHEGKEDEEEEKKTLFVKSESLKLGEFQKILTQNGIESVKENGALLCANGKILLTCKCEGSDVRMEGSLCDEYYVVRKLLYEQYTIL